MYVFALKGRWLFLLVAATVVAATCVALGFWQLDRLEQRRAHNALVEERMAQPPVPLDRVVQGGEVDPEVVAFRRVTASGTFDPDHEVILRGRTHDGRPGDHLLTPLVTGGGRAIIVDRGWIPTAREDPPVRDALPPDGEVRVAGVLLPPEGRPRLVAEGTEAPRMLSRVQPDRLGPHLPYAISPAYLLLQEQDPPQPEGHPVTAELPELDEGPHLSYAVQWFGFAVVALITYGALVSKEARKRRRGPPEAAVTPSDARIG